MKGKITFVLPKRVDLLTFAEIQISSEWKVNRMLSLRYFREQVCDTSFPHIHKAAWISGNCEGLTLATISNRPLVALGLWEDHPMISQPGEKLFFVMFCNVCLFLPFLEWWFKGIESGLAGREESQHSLNQLYLSYEFPDSRLNKRSMLGKDEEKDAIYYILWWRKWGRILNDGDYQQFILDGFHGGRLWGQICGGQNKRNSTASGLSGESWLNDI